MANRYDTVDKTFPFWSVSDTMKCISLGALAVVIDDDNFKEYLKFRKSDILYEMPAEVKALLDYIFWYNNDINHWKEYYQPQTLPKEKTNENHSNFNSILRTYVNYRHGSVR